MFDFTSFYKKYNVNISRLKRDYEKNPLQPAIIKQNEQTGQFYKLKDSEVPFIDDLIYLYIELNISRDILVKYFDISLNRFKKILKNFKIKKDKKLIQKNIEKTFIINYGATNCWKNKDVLKKREQTCIVRYGYNTPTKNENIAKKIVLAAQNKSVEQKNIEIEKRKKTCIEKHGGIGFSSDYIKNKAKKTNLERYNFENPACNEMVKTKMKNTLNSKTDAEWDNIINKIKYTKLKRYNDENYNNKEVSKNTFLKKTGYEFPVQDPVIFEKMKQTCIDKYNVPFYSQSDEYKLRHDEIIVKMINTKRKNNSWTNSKDEDFIIDTLTKHKISFIYQYKSELYPFRCDFYIPELDLYIEYQGHWTHGIFNHNRFGPYDSTNKKHQEVLDNLIKKSNGQNLYARAIYVWTKLDPKKRLIAKNNNLNFLELWNIEEFNKLLLILKEKLNNE